MAPQGSLFLNVGAKPTDPWIPLEVAQVARRCFKLQNTIHWVKSIAIDREARGRRRRTRPRRRRRPLQADQQRPLRQRLPRVHLPLHAGAAGRRLDRARRRRAVSGPVEHRALGGSRRRPALPRQHLVRALRDDPEPRSRSAAPGVISAEDSGAVPAPARRRARRSVLDPFLGLGSTAIAATRSAATSSASRWTSTICRTP